MLFRNTWNKLFGSKRNKKLELMNSRLLICSKCKYRDNAKCSINKMKIKDIVGNVDNLTCPKGYW